MKNRKLSSRYVHANIDLQNTLINNYIMLCKAAIAAYRMGAPRKKIEKILGEFPEMVKELKRDCDADVGYYMTEKRLSEIKIDIKDVVEATAALTNEPRQILIESMAINLSGLLLCMNAELGYGAVRLRRILYNAQQYEGDAEKEAGELFNFTLIDKDVLPDITKMKTQKTKLHRDEALRLKNGLAAFKAMQERNEKE